MKRTAWIAVVLTITATAGLLFVIDRSAAEFANLPERSRLEYLKLHVDLAKAVLVGFGAALLGILIPAVFAEARYTFERLRDSRTAYSEAKTGVDYLPLRLATLDLQAAAELIQNAHVKKHEAELYPELGRHLARSRIRKTPEQWGDGLGLELIKARKVLENNVDTWHGMKSGERLALVRAVLPEKFIDDPAPGAGVVVPNPPLQGAPP